MAVQFDPFVPKPGSRERYMSETAPAVDDPKHPHEGKPSQPAGQVTERPRPPASPVPPRAKGSGTGSEETMLDRSRSGLRSGTGDSSLG